jgi:GntR family transcriptional repressor for pyruvate dehydrogenase complex
VEPAVAADRTPALEAVFKPVQPPTTFEETVERLGTAIRLGLLPAGSRLPPERDLADQLRISRSTLRQALTTLVQSGHLMSVRGRAGGTFVAEQPPLGQDVAAEVLGEGARGVLDYPTAFEDYRRADVRFHIGVAECSHSVRLVAAMTEVQGQMSDLIARIAHPKEVLRSSNDQHRRLIVLLRRRDSARAVRLTREHIEGTEHILAGLLPERRA